MADFIPYRKYTIKQGKRKITLNTQKEVAENGGEGQK